MPTLLHLSDAHLTVANHEQIITDLARGIEAAGVAADAVVFTGDLFDSVNIAPDNACAITRLFIESTRRALRSPEVPFVVLPGNHDRRRLGTMLPNETGLFCALRDAMQLPGVTIAGTNDAITEVQIPRFAGPAVAYDSTSLPDGMFSAGGTLRTEDMLRLGNLLDQEDDSPILMLMHHHIIPTPVTDTGRISIDDKPILAKLGVKLLEWLVAYGDREELFMTAMGAGSGLTTLHAHNRAVLVLHGHKHYPTARLVKATVADEGDVALISAGSMGIGEAWHATDGKRPMHLWPSFNVVNVDHQSVEVQTIAFPPEMSAGSPVSRRHLVKLDRSKASWAVSNAAPATTAGPMWFASNEGRYRLAASDENPSESDLHCARKVRRNPCAPPHKRLTETIRGLRGGTLERDGRVTPLPAEVEIEDEINYVVRRAVCSTLDHAHEVHGDGKSCSWVSMPNRYGADEVILTLEAEPAVCKSAFGSFLDLTTGRETPARLERSDTAVTLKRKSCPPRSVLRIYWPLT